MPETKGLLNKAAFDQMKDGVVVLNFARDLLVNDDDMKEALESGKVAKGDQVDVQIKDIGYILAGGAIKKGEEVTATAGKATKAADGDYVIGVALSNAAENDYVRVQISKYQKNAAK